MKTAYVDITLEAISDLLMLAFDPHCAQVISFEQSPKYDNCIRFTIEGSNLPVADDDKLHRIKLLMTKEWVELAEKHFYQKAHLEIVEATIDEN